MNGDPSMKLEAEQWRNKNLLVGKQHQRWSLALSISNNKEKIQDGEQQNKLPEYYQNAVACLLNCESVISKLQENLSCKDDKIWEDKQQIAKLQEQLFYKDEQIRKDKEQVANLEQRLIEIKFKLASTKAMKDELMQVLIWLKHQILSADDSGNLKINLNANGFQKDKVQQSIAETFASNTPQLLNSPSTKTQTLPSSAVHSSTRKNKVCEWAKRRRSRSWSALNGHQSEFMPWPEHQDDKADTSSDDSKVLKTRCGFCQLSPWAPVRKT
jgi:hypothetical protein